MAKPKYTGTCRMCGCSEKVPCTLPTGDQCSWYSFDRTVCSSPSCITAFGRERAKKKAEAAERDRKKTPAEIHALICGRGKKAGKR